MKQIIAIAVVAAAALATPALAQDQNYVQLNLGGSVAGDVEIDGLGETDLDKGFFASIAAGRTDTSGISVEGEVVYLDADIDTNGVFDADVTTTAALINLTYTYSGLGAIKPYVGGGLGWGNVDYDVDGDSVDDSSVLWQVKAGATYAFSPQVSLDVGYRYINLPKFKVNDGTDTVEIESDAHVISVGARYAF